MKDRAHQLPELDVFQKDAIKGYTIFNEIGKGATGVVYAARNNQTGQLVAIKVIYSYYCRNKEFLRRLTREAELTKKLRHPNMVAGLELGSHEGYWYFVMEYVTGKTLNQLLRERLRLPEREAAQYLLEIARALDFAHRNKVVHRDVKPSNIIITREDKIKLMDFGLAKEEIDTSLTMHGTIIGTPCYISPEQARGEVGIDIRSDIYSLGTTLYHLIVGEAPFTELSTSLLLTKKITDSVPCPREKNPELSDAICYIVEKMCQRDRGLRYSTPAELIKDLEDYLAGSLEKKPISMARQVISPRQGLIKELKAKIKDEHLRALLISDKVPAKSLMLGEMEVLFYEEDQSREAYLLLQGQLEVLKSGRRVDVVAEPGKFVGEMSTMLNTRRTATVRAIEPSILLQIKEKDFLDFLSAFPQIAYRLAVDLASRLEKTTTKLKGLQSRLATIKSYYEIISEELKEE